MNKVLFQFLVLVLLFFGCWYLFTSVDYEKRLHLVGISDRAERKLGNFIFETLKNNNKEIEKDSVKQVLDKIKWRLCEANSFNPDDIHIHLMVNDEINAFTLPGHHIIVNTALVDSCDSVSQLCGVIAHELGHIGLKHIMKRLISEMGLSALASIATKGNSELAGNIIEKLSSTAFERKQESAADAVAVKYLQRAHINPQGFADIMTKLADIQGTPNVVWMSSHPDSRKRAQTITELIKEGKADYTPVLTTAEWQVLKDAAMRKYPSENRVSEKPVKTKVSRVSENHLTG